MVLRLNYQYSGWHPLGLKSVFWLFLNKTWQEQALPALNFGRDIWFDVVLVQGEIDVL